MAVDQRNAGSSTTLTAGAANAYTVDRWFATCTGASINGARTLSSGQYRYTFTGATGVTNITFGQRIEAQNCFDLAGTTATLSADLSNSIFGTVTWTASYASTTDNYTTKTQIATGTFSTTSTLSRYSAQIAIPSGATTGIEILFSVGLQTSGTWVITNAQLEPGPVATPMERRSYSKELALCQRYFEKSYTDNVAVGTSSVLGSVVGQNAANQNSPIYCPFKVTKRIAPSTGVYSPNNGAAGFGYNVTAGTNVAFSYFTGSANAYVGAQGCTFQVGVSPTVYTNYAIHWTAAAEL
jgi:hypothetical protein